MTITHKIGQTEMIRSEPADRVNALDGIQLADYELKERLGAGGYGEVWRAIGPGGLAKAVKVLYGERTGNHAEAELKALERMRELRHPFLLSIERIEVVNSRLIVVTELADKNLSQRFSECRAKGLPGIPRDELLGYLKDTADALDFMVDQHGLQHLDVKPDNILLQGNHAKVGDFGLAKNLNATNVSIVSGFTPMYAPPELFEGRPGRSSDQYSLAIVYQAMLTGKMPFNGRTAAQLTAQHLRSQPDLTELQPIDRPVIARALSKNSHSRYDSCGQFVEELVRRKHARISNPAVLTNCPDTDSNFAGTELLKTQLSEEGKARQIQASQPVRISVSPTQGKALRRSVFIGIGGLAGEVLRDVKEIVGEHQGENGETVFPLLQIDTNRLSLSTLRSTDNRVGLSADETIAIQLRSAKDYRSASELDLSWLSRRWLFNIPRSGQVDGIRPLGRLALFDHNRQVEAKLSQLLEQATTEEYKNAANRLSGLPIADSGIDVYIVGATSGGTGSGAIADIGLMIRKIVKMNDIKDLEIHGVLVHGTGAMRNVADVQEANTACLLKELRHLSTPGLGTDRGFSKSPDLRNVSPFDNTFFLHIGNGLNTHQFAWRSRSIAKFLYESTATAAQFDLRDWRVTHEDEYSAADHLRLIGIGLQDAESFQLASDQSADLCSVLLRHWCNFIVPHAGAKSTKLPASLSDSQALLKKLHLTDETLPQQVMTLLRGEKGREIEAYAAEVNDGLTSVIDPNTVTRGEVMDFLSQQLSTVTNPQQGRRSLHQIVSGVQLSLLGNTKNCELEIQNHLTQLLDMPHRLEGASVAAGFLRATLKRTAQGCSDLLCDIENTFSELALEADPDVRFAAGGHADADIKSFCQQYCVLLAYQTIYQCYLNHVATVTDFVNKSIEKLDSLRQKLIAVATDLASTAMLSDTMTQPIVDALDKHIRSSSPEFLAQHYTSTQATTELASSLTTATTLFLFTIGQEPDGLQRQDAASFPGNAWPEITGIGGRRRVLGLVPEGIALSIWEAKLKKEFGECVAMRSVADHEMTVVCEIEGVPLDAVFGCLTFENPHLVDVASRIHTRTDIEW